MTSTFDILGDSAEHPRDAVRAICVVAGNRVREGALQIFRRPTFLPGVPIELVEQHFGEVALLGGAAAEGEIKPVEVLPAVFCRDVVRCGSGLVTSGAIDVPQVVRLAQEAVDFATFEVRAFDSKCGITVIVMCRVEHAASGAIKANSPCPSIGSSFSRP